MKVILSGVIVLFIHLNLISVTVEAQTSSNHEHSGFNYSAWVKTSGKMIQEFFDSNACSTKNNTPEIKLINSSFPNAFVSTDLSLTISSGLLDRIDSSEELAFILAHEASHIILGHHLMATPTGIQEHIRREIEADAVASSILKTKKYNPQIGITVLKKLTTPRSRYATTVTREYLPSIEPRIASLSLAN